jgi:hypothetical protein
MTEIALQRTINYHIAIKQMKWQVVHIAKTDFF